VGNHASSSTVYGEAMDPLSAFRFPEIVCFCTSYRLFWLAQLFNAVQYSTSFLFI
jgi:hypothetical protein